MSDWDEEDRALIYRVAAIVRKLRLDAGLSQLDLSKAIGVSQGHIVAIEAAGTAPNLVILARMARQFGRSLNELFNDAQPLEDPLVTQEQLARALEVANENFAARRDEISKLLIDIRQVQATLSQQFLQMTIPRDRIAPPTLPTPLRRGRRKTVAADKDS